MNYGGNAAELPITCVMMCSLYNACPCDDDDCKDDATHNDGFQRPRNPVPQTACLGDFIRVNAGAEEDDGGGDTLTHGMMVTQGTDSDEEAQRRGR